MKKKCPNVKHLLLLFLFLFFCFFFSLKLSPPYFRYSPSRGRKKTLLAYRALFLWKTPNAWIVVRYPSVTSLHSSTLRFLLSTETFRSKNPLLDVRLRQKCELFRGLPQIWCLVDLRRRVGRMAPTAWRIHSRRVAVLTRNCVFVSLDYP